MPAARVLSETVLNYRIIPVTPFQQNCTVLWCTGSRAAAVVNPGGDLDRILATLTELDVNPERVLLTHGHLDHVGGAAGLARELGVGIEGPHAEDAFLLEAIPEQCQMFGFPPCEAFTPGRWLDDGDRVRVGEEELAVIRCPGHTPGHIVLYHAPSQLAQVGDVLFRGSIGRTDFPRGNHSDLLHSIRSRLFPLGDEVRFIPGHGPMSTFGIERRSNPFVADAQV